MKKSIFFIGLLLWAVFLVCIATFGGHDGQKVAGNAAWISLAVILILGPEFGDD